MAEQKPTQSRRKTREQEEFEARERAIRAYQRKLDDIAWKHETFLPAIDDFKKRLIEKKPKELPSGD